MYKDIFIIIKIGMFIYVYKICIDEIEIQSREESG